MKLTRAEFLKAVAALIAAPAAIVSGLVGVDAAPPDKPNVALAFFRVDEFGKPTFTDRIVALHADKVESIFGTPAPYAPPGRESRLRFLRFEVSHAIDPVVMSSMNEAVMCEFNGNRHACFVSEVNFSYRSREPSTLGLRVVGFEELGTLLWFASI